MQIEEYPVPNECARARQFVLIPAAVLDDRRIKAAEKIFFAEIMALSNNTGYCYATNTYFRTLYGVSVTTLQGWLANLKTCGYIKIDVIRNPDNSVKERRITPYCLDFAPYYIHNEAYYQKAIDVQLRLIERQCGFTEGTFTLDVRTGRMTATQVTSDDRDTYSTIKSIQDRGLKQGLEDVIYIYNVYATLGDLAPAGDVEPSVSFGDSVFEDTGTEFGRRKQLVDGGYRTFWKKCITQSRIDAARTMPFRAMK